jgi:hypothetical protein
LVTLVLAEDARQFASALMLIRSKSDSVKLREDEAATHARPAK